MQRLLEGAQTGRLHKVTARVQGPFGGHNLPTAEMDAPQHMIVFVGGVGAPTVLSILKRLALHRDLHHLHSGAQFCVYFWVYLFYFNPGAAGQVPCIGVPLLHTFWPSIKYMRKVRFTLDEVHSTDICRYVGTCTVLADCVRSLQRSTRR